MDVPALQAFVAIAEQHSFSRAAETLHISQPAISKRLAGLESALGAQLVNRVGRRVTLTHAGQTLLPRARRVLAEIEDASRSISRLSDHVGGCLRMGTSHHIGLHRLPETLRSYTARYPDVELDLRFMESEQACEAVLHGDLELAVVTLPMAPIPQLDMHEIWIDPLAVFVAPEHPLAKRHPVRIEEIVACDAILPDADTYTHRLVHEAFARHGAVPRVRLVTNYLETIKMLVSIGLGWSMLPTHMGDATLRAIQIDGLEVTRYLGVVSHARRVQSSAARALLGLLPSAA